MGNEALHRYSRHVYYDVAEGEFVALCSEFPHLSAFGESAHEALEELTIALEGAIAVHVAEGWPVPEPIAPPEPRVLPSGKFVVRIPRSLHARLAARAQREGVSLNTWVVALLADAEPVRDADDPREARRALAESALGAS